MTRRRTDKPETTLSRTIRRAIEAMGLRVIRMQATGKSGLRVRGGYMQLAPEGTPDLLVRLRHGRCLWLEVKRPGEQLNAAQVEEHARIAADEHTVVVVRSAQEAIDCVAREMATDASKTERSRLAALVSGPEMRIGRAVLSSQRVQHIGGAMLPGREGS